MPEQEREREQGREQGQELQLVEGYVEEQVHHQSPNHPQWADEMSSSLCVAREQVHRPSLPLLVSLHGEVRERVPRRRRGHRWWSSSPCEGRAQANRRSHRPPDS